MRGECGTENRDIAVEPRAGLLRELAVDGFVVLHFVGEDRDQPLARAPSARPLEMAVEIEIGDIADPHRLLQQHGKDRRVLNHAGLLECRPLHAVVPCEHPRRQVEQQLQRAVVHELAEARPVLRRHAPARNARHGGRLVNFLRESRVGLQVLGEAQNGLFMTTTATEPTRRVVTAVAMISSYVNARSLRGPELPNR